MSAQGSSPRGRGKPFQAHPRTPIQRLIPAWAGKTALSALTCAVGSAHPRVGGENPVASGLRRTTFGSSPRGRGKRRRHRRRGGARGLIPAWAGKTSKQPREHNQPLAHPRVGGENRPSATAARKPSGSSPRGRGKPGCPPDVWYRPGLIPAWAGKTRHERAAQESGGAHPRVGGENGGDVVGFGAVGGSSPRGRGKQDIAAARERGQGLIPAWAGKTHLQVVRRPLRGAHPRVGGENGMGGMTRRTRLGSSPRGRGKPCVLLPDRSIERLIPAWAGKTPGRAGGYAGFPAHPRVGGENSLSQVTSNLKVGSSPRGRGKLVHVPGVRWPRRLIPAWAGKTGSPDESS